MEGNEFVSACVIEGIRGKELGKGEKGLLATERKEKERICC